VNKTSNRDLMAWSLYDTGNSAFSAIIETFVFAAYFSGYVAVSQASGMALWGYTLGWAGLVVALLAPVMGAMADQGGNRKPWLGVFTAICVLATALLCQVKPEVDSQSLALWLVAIGVVSSELALVFYNAMLPDLVDGEGLGRWSGWGWAMGYAGGLICLVLALIIVREGGGWGILAGIPAGAVRATFVLAALWYLVFSLPVLLITPSRPSTGMPLMRAAINGFRQVGQTLGLLKNHRALLWFLIARMLYIDGLTTLFAFGGVFAAGTFNMDAQQVMMFAIMLNVTAGIGAAAFAKIDERMGSRRAILWSLAGLLVLSSATLLAQSKTQFLIFGVLLGFFVGPAQAASRTYMARAAPAHLRGEFFGLLAFSGKATAFLGPFAVAALVQISGSQRVGMSAILFLLLAGAILMMWRVPEADKVRDVIAIYE